MYVTVYALLCIQLKCKTVNSKMNAKTPKECSWVAVAPSPRLNTDTSTHKPLLKYTILLK